MAVFWSVFICRRSIGTFCEFSSVEFGLICAVFTWTTLTVGESTNGGLVTAWETNCVWWPAFFGVRENAPGVSAEAPVTSLAGMSVGYENLAAGETSKDT